MDLFKGAEKLLSMDEATWLRHASPWSVWSRFFTCVPLLTLAVWSRAWIGWYALLPTVLALVWIWLNPRAFKAPHSTDNWASKGTFGERIFLAHRHDALPPHHLKAANVITGISIIASVVWLGGLVSLNLSATLSGMFAVVLSKAWFVDRMVWVYHDMQDHRPEYRQWLR
ncbi:DUF6653 family protein [Vibrio sp. WXL210]|uniref:DUF6653 family protein n=1 Tax=Vibrio sp. WXL210 TaxID=3450709 RepID=UPI003EC94385